MKPLLLSFLFSLSALQLNAMEFPSQYVPEKLPEESSMPWRIWKSEETKANAAIVNGTLRVEGKSNERFCYFMGTYDNGKQAGHGQDGWNVTGGKSTVEFSFTCTADKADADTFGVIVSDGVNNWMVQFSPLEARVAGKAREISTNKADTYRISFAEGKCQLSSERHGLLFDDIKGSTGEKISNRIAFGIIGGKRNTGENVSWALNFIRWNNQEAVILPPLPKDKKDRK